MQTKFTTILLLTVTFAVSIFSQTIQLSVYDVSVSAIDLLKSKDGKTGFILVKPAKQVKEVIPFGLWLPVDSKTPFIVISEAGGKTIASISAKDFAAGAVVKTEKNSSIATYNYGKGASAIEIKIVSEIVENPLMPLSKQLSVEIFAKAAQAKNVQATMNLFADGMLSKVGANGAATAKSEKGKMIYPHLLVTGSANNTVSAEVPDAKKPGGIVKISSQAVSLNANQSDALTKFTVLCSSVRENEKSYTQVQNIEKTLTQNKEITEMALVNTANKTNPLPGDTVTFTIRYHNIGTAIAKDIVISNDVPVNMNFVENSAQGENSEITYQRKNLPPPQQSEVVGVSWKIKGEIRPGEEGTVSMKAIVR